MGTAGLALVVAAALGLLGLVLNHVYARVALVELALNEGLPPGHEVLLAHAEITSSIDPSQALGPGVHVFLSRNCHACQRLLDALAETDLALASDLHLRYIDRPRPIATAVASQQRATLHHNDAELSTHLGADPLPYTIAIGEHDLVGRSVSPTIELVLETARNAGIAAEAVL